jgi:hypothetical protein
MPANAGFFVSNDHPNQNSSYDSSSLNA